MELIKNTVTVTKAIINLIWEYKGLFFALAILNI